MAQAKPARPSISVHSYINAAKKLAGVTPTKCGYCGNSNAAVGDTWICAFCENANYASTLSIRLRDKSLMDYLDDINTSTSSGNFDRAISEYVQLLKKYNDPETMYCYALLHIKYSNRAVASISYDKPGFMTDNSVLRLKASDLVSKAKLIFYKALVLCDAEEKAGNTSPFLTYTRFIINIKLRNARTAKRLADELSKSDNQFLANYAKMLLAVEIENYGDVIIAANAINQSSANALYYTAWALFKMKRPKDAMKVLKGIDSYADTESVVALENAITRAMII